jgi:arylsulfatase A-like enzyme
MKTKNLFLAALAVGTPAASALAQAKQAMPNIVYIMADDLGMGDLGCYGQRYYHTPAIDSLAAHGIRFARHYAGCTVSAPSRCSLMTGLHTGHTYIRGNLSHRAADGFYYDEPLPADQLTVAEVLQRHHYATACIGKWGLGGPDNEGAPNRQGFDYFFGYLGQGNAHRYYPPFLYENRKKVMLDKKVYSHDLIMEKALQFIKDNANHPFFLYLVPTIPHADLIVPDDGSMNRFSFLERPYPGPGYTAQPRPKAAFAAMVTRLDHGVAQVMQLLREKGIADNTIVIFTSDNGTHVEGGHDPYFFNSSGGFRGHKRDLYEGGIRTPFIVDWPARIKQPSVSYLPSAFWDFLPTVCDLVGEPAPRGTDGISYLPTLTGQGEQQRHDYLYWEFHEEGGKQAILKDGWKLIELNVNRPERRREELYNLLQDPTERMDVSAQYPEKVRALRQLLRQAHTPSKIFPFKGEE